MCGCPLVSAGMGGIAQTHWPLLTLSLSNASLIMRIAISYVCVIHVPPPPLYDYIPYMKRHLGNPLVRMHNSNAEKHTEESERVRGLCEKRHLRYKSISVCHSIVVPCVWVLTELCNRETPKPISSSGILSFHIASSSPLPLLADGVSMKSKWPHVMDWRGCGYECAWFGGRGYGPWCGPQLRIGNDESNMEMYIEEPKTKHIVL